VKLRAFSAILATSLCVLVAAPLGGAAAPAKTGVNAVNVPISAVQSGGVLNGVFTVTNFTTNAAGQLVANGVFNGTLTQNGVTQQVSTIVSSVINIGQSQGSCQILDLVLGPLHLDLLGLVVNLDTVHLNITAQQGPGNLLGNLLCAVAHLLDNTGSNNGLANQLNHLLQAL
jgi:hypothetical protein